MKTLNEEMKSLKQLELSMPKLDIISSKSIMGGDGYGFGSEYDPIDLDEVVVRPEESESEHPDRDLDTEPNYDMDNDWDNGDGDNGEQNREEFSWDDLSKAATQVGPNCTFAAVSALLQGYGKGDGSAWLGVANEFMDNHGLGGPGLDILEGDEGLSEEQLGQLANDYFNTSEEFNDTGGLEGLASGEYDAVLGMIDTDDDGLANHAVDIRDYDPVHDEFGYWDPEDGDYHTGSGDDFKGGWGISGTK